MTIADRVATIDFRALTPRAATFTSTYVGQHRAPGTVAMTARRHLYVARHTFGYRRRFS